MPSLADLYLTVHPDTRGMPREMERAGSKAGKSFSGSFGKGIKTLVGAAAILGVARSVTGFLKEANAEARESQKVGRVTAQVIKSTGGAAKVTSKQVGDLATAISNKTGVDDEQIQHGQNLLLTFKNVRNEVGKGAKIFDRASQAAVDLSATGFGSVDSASKMLGKALNDPLKGISALSRAGVTFTDQQKKQIKVLVESGDTLGAQKLIMKEVESQVGGVAAASATAGEKLKVAWDNSKEALGTALLPALDELEKFLLVHVIPVVGDLIDKFAKWLPGAIETAKKAFRTLQDFVRPAFDTVKVFLDTLAGKDSKISLPWKDEIVDAGGKVRSVVGDLRDFFVDKLYPALKDIGDLVLNDVIPAWLDWYKFIFEKLQPILQQFIGVISANAGPVLSALSKFLREDVAPAFGAVVGAVKDLLSVVLPIISEVVGVIIATFTKMRPQLAEIWTNIKDIVVGVMFVLKEVIQAVTTIIRLIWEKWGTQIKQFIGLIFEGIINIIGGAMKIIAGVIKLIVALIKGDWSGAWNAIKQIFAGVWQAIKGILQVVTAALWVTLQIWWTKVKELWTSATGKIRTTWSNFWANVKRVASDMINSVRTTISNVLGKIRDGFATAVNAIARAWSRIQAAVRDPIKFVIETVLDKGILGAVRAISKFVNFKAGENIHVSLPKGWGSTVAVASAGRLASGGVLPGYTPGRDVHRFYSATGGVLDLSGGEGIARPEIVRAIGKKRWDAANKAARNSRIDDAMHYLGGHASGTSGINAAKNYASSIGLGRGSTYPGHGELGSNLAWDFMTGNRSKGEQLANWAWANAKAIHLWYEIYYRRIRSMTRPGAGWRPYTRYGANASPSQAHTNHVHLSFYRAALGALSGGLVGAGSGQAGGGGGGLAALDPSKYLKMVTDALGKLKSIKGSPFGQMVASVANLLGDKIKAKITDLAASFMAPTPGAAGGKFTAAGGGSNRAIGHRMMLQRWSEANWPALNSLWTRESGWRTTARNPSSGAYGIPQSLPASKMASAGSDWRTNPATQIKWGLGYIAGRYGSPIGAWAHSQRTGWYDRGGMLPPGATMAYNNTGRDELITPLPRGWSLADQDDKLDQLIAVLSTGPRPLIDSVHWHSEGTVHDDMEELSFQLRRLDRGGVYR